jgi:hypothetical protein
MQSDAKVKLAQSLAAVADRLEAKAAAQACATAAALLSPALEKDPEASKRAARCLAAVARRLEPAAAARLCQALSQALARTLEERAFDHVTVPDLVEGLAAAAGRLDSAAAERVCAQGIGLLLAARTKFLEFPQLATLFEAPLAALLRFLSREAAGQLAKELALSICADRGCNADEFSRADRAEALNALLQDASQSLLPVRAAAATPITQAAAGPPSSLSALPTGSEPLPCRLSTQDLVELLKMPTCYGRARKVVLKHLGNRYGRRFATHWEFVRFARAQGLNLDFTTPPQRPGPKHPPLYKP